MTLVIDLYITNGRSNSKEGFFSVMFLFSVGDAAELLYWLLKDNHKLKF